jgi:uncharacterized damage-inducible protein DinB
MRVTIRRMDVGEHTSEPAPTRWTESTIYPDMWVDPDDDPREADGEAVDERSILLDYLRHYRLTLEMKCAGLDARQMAQRSVPPSTMSLLGLVRHMAEVERSWFRRVVDGQDVPLVWSPDGDFQVAYDASGADRAEAFAAWEAEIAHGRRIERAAPSLDVTGVDRRHGTVYSLRLVMLHLIQEYARHNGHADLLRQGLDGVTGV